MEEQNVLKLITDTAQKVGYGSKKHFATYDIVEKAPGLIVFFSITVGIFGLFIKPLTTTGLSAAIIVLGIVGMYINSYTESKHKYEQTGTQLIKLYNELKGIYYEVKSSGKSGFESELKRLKEIEDQFNDLSMSKQILFSDWYTHYKFYWQKQNDWLEEQKKFSFWRDKIPLSFWFALMVLVLLVLIISYAYSPECIKLWECMTEHPTPTG